MTDTFDRFCQPAANGCIEWTGCRGKRGYGRYRSQAAHRVAYERANGPIPAGMVVCHTCDNPPCVNPEHLWLGTIADNNRDMVEKQRQMRWNGRRSGNGNPRAKITAEDAAAIRALRGKLRQREIAERFGISRSTVAGIVTWKTWA